MQTIEECFKEVLLELQKTTQTKELDDVTERFCNIPEEYLYAQSTRYRRYIQMIDCLKRNNYPTTDVCTFFHYLDQWIDFLYQPDRDFVIKRLTLTLSFMVSYKDMLSVELKDDMQEIITVLPKIKTDVDPKALRTLRIINDKLVNFTHTPHTNILWGINRFTAIEIITKLHFTLTGE